MWLFDWQQICSILYLLISQLVNLVVLTLSGQLQFQYSSSISVITLLLFRIQCGGVVLERFHLHITEFLLWQSLTLHRDLFCICVNGLRYLEFFRGKLRINQGGFKRDRDFLYWLIWHSLKEFYSSICLSFLNHHVTNNLEWSSSVNEEERWKIK